MFLRCAAFHGLVAAALLAGACDDEDPPADAEGSYTIAITNGDNECDFQDWDEGATSMNIPLTITQDGGELMATVEGLAGSVIRLRLGSEDFEGRIEGTSFVLENFGTRSFTDGQCAFTIKSTARGQIDGDVITGSLEYTPVTNGSPACAAIEGCVSEQLFNGTRPPTR